MKSLCFLVLVLCLYGCSSLSYRASSDKRYPGEPVSSGPYPSVRGSVKEIRSSNSDLAAAENVDPFADFILLLDIPFSFVMDTIFLPYDFRQKDNIEDNTPKKELP
jgi:uncharacterized protein YceK